MPPKKIFKNYFFDLDDTLLNTYECLLPFAIREACEAMIQNGLKASVSEAISFYKMHTRRQTKFTFFEAIVSELGLNAGSSRKQTEMAGVHAFYQRDVKEDLLLTPGSRQVLDFLFDKSQLFLVSAGDYKTQRQKIAKLDIQNYFKQIVIVDSNQGENKGHAFLSLIKTYSIKKDEILVVGNRRDQEIKEANSLGIPSCLYNYGEHSHLIPQSALEVPNYEIKTMDQLINF